MAFGRVAGLDVSKKDVKCCVALTDAAEVMLGYSMVTTTHVAMHAGLVELSQALVEAGVELVVLEATGDYWKPVY